LREGANQDSTSRAAKFDVNFNQLRHHSPRIASDLQLRIEMQSGDKYDIEEPDAELRALQKAP